MEVVDLLLSAHDVAVPLSAVLSRVHSVTGHDSVHCPCALEDAGQAGAVDPQVLEGAVATEGGPPPRSSAARFVPGCGNRG